MDLPINPPYKPPYVYIGKEEAYVSVSWYNQKTEQYEREKVRLGVKGLNKTTKRQLLNELCTRIGEIVKVRNKNLIYHDHSVIEFEEKRYLDDTLMNVFSVFNKDEETPKFQRESAQAFVTRFKEFSNKYPDIVNMSLSMFTKGMVKEYVKFLQSKNLTGKTINNHLWTLSKVMEKVTESSGIVFSFKPDDLRVKQVKNETELYKPLTNEEKEKIFSFFSNNKEEYYRNYSIFLFFIYYTCIRPGEIMRLQLSYINMNDRTIYIPWYKSKNGLSKYVQILEPLYNILMAMRLEQFPTDYFLFSHRFFPGEFKKTSKNVSELWLLAVRKLEIVDKQMYGLKHTFNKDYVENNKHNIDWEWLRRHNRHATIQQTQDYISGLTAYFLDEEKNIILDHT